MLAARSQGYHEAIYGYVGGSDSDFIRGFVAPHWVPRKINLVFAKVLRKQVEFYYAKNGCFRIFRNLDQPPHIERPSHQISLGRTIMPNGLPSGYFT